jgi:hypothetical protein
MVMVDSLRSPAHDSTMQAVTDKGNCRKLASAIEAFATLGPKL